MNNNSQHRKLRAAAQSSELSAITAVSTAVGGVGDFVLQEFGNAVSFWVVTGSWLQVMPLRRWYF